MRSFVSSPAMHNISVNADTRERAFVQQRANQRPQCCSEHLAARGCRLP